MPKGSRIRPEMKSTKHRELNRKNKANKDPFKVIWTLIFDESRIIYWCFNRNTIFMSFPKVLLWAGSINKRDQLFLFNRKVSFVLFVLFASPGTKILTNKLTNLINDDDKRFPVLTKNLSWQKFFLYKIRVGDLNNNWKLKVWSSSTPIWKNGITQYYSVPDDRRGQRVTP